MQFGNPFNSLSNLCDSSVCSLQTSLDALRWFISKLDRGLEKSDREFRMNFCRDPETELFVDILCCGDLKNKYSKFNPKYDKI